MKRETGLGVPSHTTLGSQHLFPQAAFQPWEESLGASRLVSQVSIVARGATAEAVHVTQRPAAQVPENRGARRNGTSGESGRAPRLAVGTGMGDARRARLPGGRRGGERARGLGGRGRGGVRVARPRREGAEPLGGLSRPWSWPRCVSKLTRPPGAERAGRATCCAGC